MADMPNIDISKYKKLTECEHVLLRPGRYLGTVAPQTQRTYTFKDGAVEWRDVTYSPAFLKLFDEIVTNSVDFSKREEGKHLNRIDISCSLMTGEITVRDNGGIPVVMHPEHNQWLPDMLLGELRAGSNFNDDDTDGDEAAGQNGEGASLAGIFSTSFHVTTADRKNKFDRKYLHNFKERTTIMVTPCKEGFTNITYTPDYARLGCVMDLDHFAMIERRAIEIAACNPGLKVYFNGKKVEASGFKEFIHRFDPIALYTESDKWQIGLGHSGEGFKHVAFVNSTLTFVGGTHVEYVAGKIVEGIRAKVKKLTKQDVKPSDIRNHFSLFINARVNKPRYSSQTKENLISDYKSWGSLPVIDEKFLKRVIASPIVTEIVQWAMRKQAGEDAADLAKKLKEGKKSSLNDILKYEPAGAKDRSKCMLIVCEGDSASGPILEARNPDIHGVLPMRGKSMNVRNATIAEVKKNAELINMMRIVGLEIGKVPVRSELRYPAGLLIATDQDWDGHHIRGLLLNMVQTFWPTLLEDGWVLGLQTPIVRVVQGKQTLEFFSEDDYHYWQATQTKPYTAKFLKGLGGNTHEHFRKYLSSEDFMVSYTFEAEDLAALDIAYQSGSDSADIRKKWIFE